jgi:integrase/recombinase XerD
MMKTTDSFPSGRIGSLGEAKDAYLDHCRVAGNSPATLKAVAGAIRRFAKFWGDRDVREASRGDFEAYATLIRSQVSRETAYQYLACIRALFRFLAQTHVLLVDPAAGLPIPKMAHRVTGPTLAPAEMKRLIDSATGLRDRALLEFLYSTGLRLSEATRVALQDLGDGRVIVRGGKGGKDRVVPVGANAMACVTRYLPERKPKNDALFQTDTGRPFGSAWLSQVIRRLGQAAGLAVNAHTIRRSLATHLLAAGASPSEVAAILGHEDLRSLSRYAAAVERDLKETHAKTHPREVSP